MKKFYPNFLPEVNKFLMSFPKRKIFFYEFKFDKKGIIIVEYKMLEGNKRVYHPLVIMEFGLANFNWWLETKIEEFKIVFLKHARWILKNVNYKENFAYWKLNWKMRLRGYKFEKPYDWASCIPQGFGLSVLIRAFKLEGNNEYLHLAEKILNSFYIKYEISGGIVEIDKDENLWFLEFPAKKSHGKVLNGMIFALLSLYDYYKLSGNNKALNLFNEGIKTIRSILDNYELKLLFFIQWTKYDDYKMFYAHLNYHKLHIMQLRELYNITRDINFNIKADKWEKWVNKYKYIIKVIDFPLQAIQKLLGLFNR